MTRIKCLENNKITYKITDKTGRTIMHGHARVFYRDKQILLLKDSKIETLIDRIKKGKQL